MDANPLMRIFHRIRLYKTVFAATEALKDLGDVAVSLMLETPRRMSDVAHFVQMV